MSGYDPNLNIFEMPYGKCVFWFGRTFEDIPSECLKVCECCSTVLSSRHEVIVALLNFYGCPVLKEGDGFLVVNGSPEAIWEALSGQPSAPERAGHYYRNSIDLSEYASLLKKES